MLPLLQRLRRIADVDIRTARKAVEHGPASVRGRAGQRLEVAMRALGLIVTYGELRGGPGDVQSARPAPQQDSQPPAATEARAS